MLQVELTGVNVPTEHDESQHPAPWTLHPLLQFCAQADAKKHSINLLYSHQTISELKVY
jgi:hypothetical protein